MDRTALGAKLTEFFLLEAYQVKMFSGQIPSLDEEHLVKAYEHMVEVEQGHAGYFAGKLREIDLGTPELVDATFHLAGLASAKALDLFSPAGRYRFGVFVEEKAFDMYGEFIRMAQDDEALTRVLWKYRIDEEFHQHWFEARLAALARAEEHARV